MRWIFVLLVLANAFYAFWHLQGAPQTQADKHSLSQAGVPTLVLLGEADPQLLDSPEAGLVHIEEPVVELIESSCWFVSAFDGKKAADQAVEAIQFAQLQARLDAAEVEDRSDYWVHVGPFSSRERAMRVLQELRAKNIDSFLIGEGELKNGISLGFFSQKSSAERLVTRYRNIGYPIGVFEVKRYKTRYELYASGRVEKAELEALMKERGLKVDPAKKPKKSCI